MASRFKGLNKQTYLIASRAAAAVSCPVDSCRVVSHLPLPEPIDEEEEQGQRDDGSHAAGHQLQADVGGAVAVLHFAVVTWKKSVFHLLLATCFPLTGLHFCAVWIPLMVGTTNCCFSNSEKMQTRLELS